MDSFDSNNSGGLRDEAPGECGPASCESDSALWQLLGRSRSVEASPYFVRKVLREIEAAPEPAWWRSWQFLLRTLAPSAVCAGIAIVAIAGTIGTGAKQPTVANADLEFETIQNLDLLVSNYESSIWLDPSSPSR